MIENLDDNGGFVSTMRVDIGDWVAKPVFTVVDHRARVTGYLVTARPGTTTGANLKAIWYQRPADVCEEWPAHVFVSGDIAEAIKTVKVANSIPDIQDPYWEVDVPVGTSQAATAPYNKGFVANDPVGTAVNSLPSSTRDEMVEFFKGVGEPVADVPFEKQGSEAARIWLVRTTSFFEHTVGRGMLEGPLGEHIYKHYNGFAMWPDDSPPVCRDYYSQPVGGCTPSIIYGEWRASGQLCDCETTGPRAMACGTFTADARGKVKIRVPFPPPLGSDLELIVGIGATVQICVCVWQRTCYGDGVRTRTRVNADCSRTQLTDERMPRMQFTRYFWEFASAADQCGLSGRPAGCPPSTQPCHLNIPTPDDPNP